jgi:hypothetical protein
VRTAVRLLPALAALAVLPALAGCGGSSGGTSCSGTICTVQSDGPATFDLDQLGTRVTLSHLTDDSVTVRVNADQAVVRRGADPARLRGFLVSAPETGTDRVKVRIER